MSKKIVIAGIAVLLMGAFLVWLFTASSKPLPGQKMDDLGRKHVPAGSLQNAEGDMATSGDHYGDWTRAGVYETPLDDGNLIHSMEHGYIVMYFKCQISNVKSDEATESGNVDETCDQRKSQLEQVFEQKGKRKLIVVPRPNLSTNFALTAWNWIDKFDSFDEKRITDFIDAHRDQGPERTQE